MPEYLEWIAVAFNIGYVILAAREKVWCWPLGIIGSGLSIWLFIHAKLYAESVLFTYYVFMGIYGWQQWVKKRTVDDTLKITDWPWRRHILYLILGYILTFLLFLTLKTFTDARMPLLDSFTTIFSFIATWMTAKRVIENWIYWIAIDALSVYLYYSRGLEVYALLSVVYTIMAVYGFYNWNKNLPGKTVES